MREPEADPTVAARYEAPRLHCDLILKGGIVSGLVYPGAVCDLAAHYRFHNLGGTSSGAMAAAAAAAAEHGRRAGRGEHFARLARVPAELSQAPGRGQPSRLLALFQAAPATRPLFDVFLAGLTPGARWLRLPLTLVGSFPLAALLGALPGTLLLAALASGASPLGLALGGLAAAAVAVAGALLGALLGAALRALTALPDNCYGACTGYAAGAAGELSLTVWLADLLDELAGKPPRAAPLTLGDLWGGAGLPDEQRINLELMTTCLTQGRPVRIAHEHPELTQQFYFRREELARFFPPWVMAWLLEHPRASERGDPAPDGLHRLPAMSDLPVVVAVRLSLSFPFLLSAVPLYAIDRSPHVAGAPAQRCLFSDGGICSNFPIHFFDKPLPRWPTFGLNLRSFHPLQGPAADEAQNVWMPSRNSDGRQPEWQPLDHVGRWGRLGAFAGQIVQTGLAWRDNAYLRAPGYFDRVAHIFLTDREGGLNLAMGPAEIERLARRGRAAAGLILERYAGPPPPGVTLTWDNHRWARYRTLMLFIQPLLERLAHRYEDRSYDERSYGDLVRRGRGEPPTSYPFQAQEREAAERGADVLIELHHAWEAAGADMADNAPRPGPELRITPRT